MTPADKVAGAGTSSPDEIERRRRALELSGWGLPFRFLQPRNPCFWIFVALVAWGAFQMWKQLSQVNLEFTTQLSSVVLLGLYGLILGLIFLKVDRYGGQPGRLLTAALLWGGVAAVFGMAIPANDALSEIYGKVFGQAFVIDWWAAFSAPIVEETSKAAGFLLLLGLAPGRIRSVWDALLVGAFLGLGFEILEDLIYTFNAAAGSSGADQVQAALQMFFVRSGTGFFSHAIYTALFCSGLIYLIGTPALPRSTGRGILLMVAAVISHGVWDGAGAIANGGGAAILVSAGIVVVMALVFTYVYRLGAPREREWMRDILRPEETGGAISGEELDAAAGTWRQSRSFVRTPGGNRRFRGRKRRRQAVKASRHLARELVASGGVDSPGVDKVRTKIALLRTI